VRKPAVKPPAAQTSPIPAAIERRYAQRGSVVASDLDSADSATFIVKLQLQAGLLAALNACGAGIQWGGSLQG
jgi:hypothetical protein